MDGKAYLKMNRDGAKRYSLLKKQGFTDFLRINQGVVDSYDVISTPNKHTFSGYYDISNISPDGEKIFYLTVARHSSPKYNKAEINIYNVQNKTSKIVGRTSAWCWQQGSRIRWLPRSNTKLLYNDYSKGGYVSRVVDIETGQISEFSPIALYDVSFPESIGISVNFQRLQFLRPGYGYSKGKNVTSKEFAPRGDGIFTVDLRTKNTKLIYSLNDLARQVQSNSTDFHYINHISVSPNGKRFMFFHLWTKDNLDMWNMRLLVSNVDGKNLMEIEGKDIISHYCWIDSDRIMVTKVANKEPCYIIYNLITGAKKIIPSDKLINDGHPTFFQNGKDFVSDTYPLHNCIQTMFLSHIDTNMYIPVVEAFSDPRFYIEKRCDMHPRLDEEHNIINLDSTFSKGLRKIIVLNLKKENKNNDI